MENAVKIARAFTGRQAVICFEHAFHGRTYMALTLTDKQIYKEGFGPFCPEVYRAPFPYPYRPADADTCFVSLEKLVLEQLGASKVAAIVLEPMLGEGGFIPAPADFLKRLRQLCTQHGIILVADEVQTGFGRTLGRCSLASSWEWSPTCSCPPRASPSGCHWERSPAGPR